MGSGTRVLGPVGFMPSDGRFLAAKDMHGLPTGRDSIRSVFRVVEVKVFPPGEVVNNRKMAKGFWAMTFERPSHEWLRIPWDAKPEHTPWERSKKEWKFGPTVCHRLMFRLGGNAMLWTRSMVPVCQEITSFGNDNVYCIRPVPYAWESNPEKVREAMRKLANGTYEPPGLRAQYPAPVESKPEDQPPEPPDHPPDAEDPDNYSDVYEEDQ